MDKKLQFMASPCQFLKTPLLKYLTFPKKEKGGSKGRSLQKDISINSSNMHIEIQTGQNPFHAAILIMIWQKLSCLSRYTSLVKGRIQLCSSITWGFFSYCRDEDSKSSLFIVEKPEKYVNKGLDSYWCFKLYIVPSSFKQISSWRRVGEEKPNLGPLLILQGRETYTYTSNFTTKPSACKNKNKEKGQKKSFIRRLRENSRRFLLSKLKEGLKKERAPQQENQKLWKQCPLFLHFLMSTLELEEEDLQL